MFSLACLLYQVTLLYHKEDCYTTIGAGLSIEAAKAAEKSVLACAAGENERRLLREIYYARVFGRLGFPPFVSTEDFGAVYPELKIPKPRGRMKKE